MRSLRDDIEETAAVWLLRAVEGLSPDDQARLEAWLNGAPEHRMAYWRLEYGWEKAGRLSALRAPETLAETVAQASRAPSPRRGWSQWAMGATAALAVVALAASLALSSRVATYTTETGERRLVALSDGSRVELNTQTRVRTSLSAENREAWLDRGEAYFEVAHDASRPFTVHAGDRTVTVLGTRFSVRRDGGNLRVLVAEGRVRLSGSAKAQGSGPVILVAGDIATGEGVSVLQSHTSVDGVQDQIAWRRGLLVFDQVRLADAVAEFNRYNETQLAVDDVQVANIRIGGSFEAANAEAFARLLRSAYGLEIKRDGETVKISE